MNRLITPCRDEQTYEQTYEQAHEKTDRQKKTRREISARLSFLICATCTAGKPLFLRQFSDVWLRVAQTHIVALVYGSSDMKRARLIPCATCS